MTPPAEPPATPSPLPANGLRFGRFELQPQERRLLVDGVPANLGGRALDLLITLAQRPGQLMTKGQLLDQVWPGLVVGEANLAVQVSNLRKAVGNELIVTVPGRGYFFAVAPSQLQAGGAETAAPGASALAAAQAWPAGVPGGRLFGRGADLEAVRSALAPARLLTLVGPAGIGKTRLAHAVAASWLGRWAWVDLASLAEPGLLPAALARSLGVSIPEADPMPPLARALRDETLLVVLDNAEHLVAAVAALTAALIAAGARANWLATSQVPLSIADERAYRLDPLALPDDEGDGSDDDALALLIDRITAAHHRFRADAATLPGLRRLCARLDGLPLAIEMAAARVPLLGVKGVVDALDSRFALLTAGARTSPSRHRTLHAALDWSHGLLTEGEQRFFRRLAVFAGDFTIDFAVAVGGGEGGDRWATIDLLAAVVERSMVATGVGDAPRYRLLETMRDYALERLQLAGEADAAWRRLALALRELLQRAIAVRTTPAGLGMLLPEMPNLREALVWARRHEPALAIELIANCAVMTAFTPWRNEVLGWLFESHSLLVPSLVETLPPALHARWWAEFARAHLIRMRPGADQAARQAVAAARQAGDEALLNASLVALVRSLKEPGAELDAAVAELEAVQSRHPDWSPMHRLGALGAFALARQVSGDFEGTLEIRRRELALARRTGVRGTIEAAETNVLAGLQRLGRYEETITLASELAPRLEAAGSTNAPWAWLPLVGSLIELGRLDQARQALPPMLAALRRLDLPPLSGYGALVAARRQRPRTAARLVGHALEAFRQRGTVVDDGTRSHLDEARRAARQALGEALADALEAQGRQLDDDAAAALTCGDGDR